MTTYQFSGSSSVQKIAYDEMLSHLFVTFTNGSVYKYSNVPFDVYSDFCDSASPGSFVHSRLKGKYEYEQVL